MPDIFIFEKRTHFKMTAYRRRDCDQMIDGQLWELKPSYYGHRHVITSLGRTTTNSNDRELLVIPCDSYGNVLVPERYVPEGHRVGINVNHSTAFIDAGYQILNLRSY